MDITSIISNFLIPHAEETFPILLILMVVIWTSGRVFAKLSLPPVLGEILAGVLIGPAVLGIVPETEAIKVLAELGVFFIMFHAGLDTDPKELLKSSKDSIAIAIGGVTTLFTLGTGIMYYFEFPLITSIYMGAVLAVTSFPVITRILKDLNLNKTKIGHTILGATVIDDILAFILISIVIGMAQAGEFNLVLLIFIIFKVILFFIGTLFLGFKILPYFKKFLNKTGTKGFTFSLIVALIFGLFAEFIGLHMILGAYLGGIFVRQEITNEKAFNKIEDRYFGIAHSFMGPIFFATIGMTVSFAAFTESSSVIFILLAIVFIGQWIGSGGAAFLFTKFSFREASAIALGTSGRGVMEIIIAKIGYDTFILNSSGESIRLLSNELFSGVVVIAIVTTFAAPFLLRFTLPPKYLEQAKTS